MRFPIENLKYLRLQYFSFFFFVHFAIVIILFLISFHLLKLHLIFYNLCCDHVHNSYLSEEIFDVSFLSFYFTS